VVALDCRGLSRFESFGLSILININRVNKAPATSKPGVMHQGKLNTMDKRPKLDKGISIEDFKEFYWLKEELVALLNSMYCL